MMPHAIDDEPDIPLDDEPDIPLEPEPEPTAPIPAPSTPAAPLEESRAFTGLMDVLPADFPLGRLAKFVPTRALRTSADEAARYALEVDVKGGDGLQRADAALTVVRSSLKAIEAHFEDPKDLANQLHKGITSTLAEWLAAGKNAVTVVGQRIAIEQRRLKAIDDEARRVAQEEANRQARDEARREAEAAAKNQAPAPVVQELRQRAETAQAAPVTPVQTASAVLQGSTVVENWTATIAGTPREAPQHPDMEDLTPEQCHQIDIVLKAIREGRAPRAALQINWSYLKKRAKADKSTFAIPGFEAYDAGGVRAKAQRTK